MSAYIDKETLIKAENISLKFGKTTILRDIGTQNLPFCIKDTVKIDTTQGQIIAVVGRSGRGKSSFFKLLTGLLKPTTGQILIPELTQTDHKPILNYKTVEEGDVGFVQQKFPLSRNENVLTMLTDAAIKGNINATERPKIIEQYLREWGLDDKRHYYKKQLSGGQQQRVAIIEQLLCSHYFIVLDEPFSGLDVANIEDVIESLQKITSSHEINTIIFSTHDIDLAVRLADEVFVLGFETQEDQTFIPGGTLIAHFDLKQMQIAWQPMSQKHHELTEAIKTIMKKS